MAPLSLTLAQARRVAALGQALSALSLRDAPGKRGNFILPILHGDRLVGRIDPLLDRRVRILRMRAVHREPDAPRGAPLKRVVGELAAWLGAEEISWA